VFDSTENQLLHHDNDSAAFAPMALGMGAHGREGTIPSILNVTPTPGTIGAAYRHICFVTETYPPEINGVALTLARLVKGLATRGRSVSVVRPYSTGLIR
jgi:hypothetical protein